MAVSHVYSNTNADATGTLTIWNGPTTSSVVATNLVRPIDWNSAHNQYMTITGNTAGQSTFSGTNIVFGGTNGITLSGVNATQINVAGVPPGTATFWWPFNEGVNVAGQQGNATWNICPIPTPPTAALGEVQVDRLCIPQIISCATNSTGTVSVSYWFGLYTKTSNSISLQYSTSHLFTTNFSGTANSTLISGIRLVTIPWTTTLADNGYYVALATRTSSSSQNCSVSQMLKSELNSNFSGVYGAGSNRSNQWPLGLGVYSASSTAVPGSIAFSQIDGTASLVARPPTWFMISSTV